MAFHTFGRDVELEEFDALLVEARSTFSGIVLEGEPGIGKTTLWREGIARATARGYRVLSCRTAAAEARLSFSALGDLLAPFDAAAFDALPDPQRRALDAALLRGTSERPPDPRAIGTGIVSLVVRQSAQMPVLLAIDDLQWVDQPSARALEFALRRLGASPVAVLATARLSEQPGDRWLLSTPHERIRRRRLGPLSLAALYRLTEQARGRGLPRPVLIRIERAAAGNPFYALELVRALDEQGGSLDLPVPKDLLEMAARRLKLLPQATRDALLRVSALARPEIGVIDAEAIEPAEHDGIVRVHANGRIEFVHPLFAGAIYAGASSDRRRNLHRELVEMATDIEERARHRMLSVSDGDADPEVSALLHEAADHALRRGAVEVAAELEEQSGRRMPLNDDTRWWRLLRAARHSLRAGDPVKTSALCEEVLRDTPTGSLRAHALHLQAEALMTSQLDKSRPLLEEARSCTDDPAHQAELDLSLAILFFSAFDVVPADRHLVSAIELAEKAGSKPLLAEALALRAMTRVTCGQGVDEQMLERALALEDPEREVRFQLRATFNVAQAYQYIVQPVRARELYEQLRDRLAERGEEADIPWVLCQLAGTNWQLGHFALAEDEASEAVRTASFTGGEIFRAFGLAVRAWIRVPRGNLEGARTDAEESRAISERIKWGNGVSQSSCALGSVALAEGRHQAALDLFAPTIAQIEALDVYEWALAMALPDAIEALSLNGQHEHARRLTEKFAAFGRRLDRAWAMATAGRCLAFVEAATGNVANAIAAAEQALIDHARLPMPFEHGRTLLLLGQLQRRNGARRLARQTLEQALAEFDRIGATGWSVKAAAEIGRIAVRRAPSELTDSEHRVAELVAQGLSNPEIAARLFMSRRTVEANLSRVFQKLSVRSRVELTARIASRRH